MCLLGLNKLAGHGRLVRRGPQRADHFFAPQSNPNFKQQICHLILRELAIAQGREPFFELLKHLGLQGADIVVELVAGFAKTLVEDAGFAINFAIEILAAVLEFLGEALALLA